MYVNALVLTLMSARVHPAYIEENKRLNLVKSMLKIALCSSLYVTVSAERQNKKKLSQNTCVRIIAIAWFRQNQCVCAFYCERDLP